MNCKKAKSIDLVSYLKKQGFLVAKATSKDTWFYSPFREENTPSFKVNNANIFYDFGEGIGGTIIDFLMKYNNCSVKQALEALSKETFSIHQQKKQINIEHRSTYSIKKVAQLTDQRLLNYLNIRKINLRFAKQFCLQVNYSFSNGIEYYGIGFKNDSGGYEIRNKFFKGCLGKKAITQIKNNSSVVSVFESWSDFLSYLTLKKRIPFEDFLILNSTSMSKNVPEFTNGYSRVRLFLDNDSSGDSATSFLFQNLKTEIIDERIHYKNHKDLNELLISLSINAV